MDEIRKILSLNHILTNDELRYLVFLFKTMYEIDSDITIEIDKNAKYPISYDIENDKININWNLLKKEINKDDITSSNYILAFLLLHELNHALQKRRIDRIKDYVSYVYSICFSFLEQFPIPLVSELKQMIYDEGHDLFPTEINADIMGYMSMLKILDGFDMQAYDHYKECLKNRLLSLYKDRTLDYFFTHILRVERIDYTYPMEEAMLYGLPILVPIKENDIMKLIK